MTRRLATNQDVYNVHTATGRLAISLAFACVTAAASAARPSTQPIPQVRTQAPGFCRLMVGDYEITAVSDGTLPVPLDKVLTNTTPGQVAALLARTYQTLPLETSINTFLINTGSKLILIDTGAGGILGPTHGGRFVTNLRAAGYQPEPIDTVLLTHIHGDHSAGLVVDGKMTFPNALVYVHEREKEYWLNATEAGKATVDQKEDFAQAHAVLTPYIDADRLKTFVPRLSAPGPSPRPPGWDTGWRPRTSRSLASDICGRRARAMSGSRRRTVLAPFEEVRTSPAARLGVGLECGQANSLDV